MLHRLFPLLAVLTITLTGCITTGASNKATSSGSAPSKSSTASGVTAFGSGDSGIPSFERRVGEAALRPAQALLARKDTDGALKALDATIADETIPSYYRAQAADMKGDILIKQRRDEQAAVSFEAAARLYDTVSYSGVYSKNLRNDAILRAVPAYIRAGHDAHAQALLQQYGLTNNVESETAWTDLGFARIRHTATGITFPKTVGSFKLERKRVNADNPYIFDVTYTGYNGSFTIFHYNNRTRSLEDEAWGSFKVFQKIVPITGFALKKTIPPGEFNDIQMEGYVIEDVMQRDANSRRYAAGIATFKKGKTVYKIRYVLNETQISAKLSNRPSEDMPGFAAVEILTYLVEWPNGPRKIF